MPPLLTSTKKLRQKLSNDIKSHSLTININFFKQIDINQRVFGLPDPPPSYPALGSQPQALIKI